MARRDARKQAPPRAVGERRIVDARVNGSERVLFATLRVGKQRHVEYHAASIPVTLDGAAMEISVDDQTRYGPLEQLSGT